MAVGLLRRMIATSRDASDAFLQAYIDNAWAVREAGDVSTISGTTMGDPGEIRVKKLKDAAAQMPCICAGIWQGGAKYILCNNGEAVGAFCPGAPISRASVTCSTGKTPGV